eukprot:g58470.t1
MNETENRACHSPKHSARGNLAEPFARKIITAFYQGKESAIERETTIHSTRLPVLLPQLKKTEKRDTFSRVCFPSHCFTRVIRYLLEIYGATCTALNLRRETVECEGKNEGQSSCSWEVEESMPLLKLVLWIIQVEKSFAWIPEKPFPNSEAILSSLDCEDDLHRLCRLQATNALRALALTHGTNETAKVRELHECLVNHWTEMSEACVRSVLASAKEEVEHTIPSPINSSISRELQVCRADVRQFCSFLPQSRSQSTQTLVLHVVKALVRWLLPAGLPLGSSENANWLLSPQKHRAHRIFNTMDAFERIDNARRQHSGPQTAKASQQNVSNMSARMYVIPKFGRRKPALVRMGLAEEAGNDMQERAARDMRKTGSDLSKAEAGERDMWAKGSDTIRTERSQERVHMTMLGQEKDRANPLGKKEKEKNVTTETAASLAKRAAAELESTQDQGTEQTKDQEAPTGLDKLRGRDNQEQVKDEEHISTPGKSKEQEDNLVEAINSGGPQKLKLPDRREGHKAKRRKKKKAKTENTGRADRSARPSPEVRAGQVADEASRVEARTAVSSEADNSEDESSSSSLPHEGEIEDGEEEELVREDAEAARLAGLSAASLSSLPPSSVSLSSSAPSSGPWSSSSSSLSSSSAAAAAAAMKTGEMREEVGSTKGVKDGRAKGSKVTALAQGPHARSSYRPPPPPEAVRADCAFDLEKFCFSQETLHENSGQTKFMHDCLRASRVGLTEACGKALDQWVQLARVEQREQKKKTTAGSSTNLLDIQGQQVKNCLLNHKDLLSSDCSAFIRQLQLGGASPQWHELLVDRDNSNGATNLAWPVLAVFAALLLLLALFLLALCARRVTRRRWSPWRALSVTSPVPQAHDSIHTSPPPREAVASSPPPTAAVSLSLDLGSASSDEHCLMEGESPSSDCSPFLPEE